MNQKVLNTLEYDKVIERLKAYATTELGKAACEKLEPMTDEPEISLAQEQTQDALTRLYKQGSISFFGVQDRGFSETPENERDFKCRRTSGDCRSFGGCKKRTGLWGAAG